MYILVKFSYIFHLFFSLEFFSNDSMLQEKLNSRENYPNHNELKRNFSSIISEDNSLIKPIMNQDFTNYYSDLLQTLFANTDLHEEQPQQQSFNYPSSSINHRQKLKDFVPSLPKVSTST